MKFRNSLGPPCSKSLDADKFHQKQKKTTLFLFGTYPNSPIIPECRDSTCCQYRANCQAGHVIRLLAVSALPHQSRR